MFITILTLDALTEHGDWTYHAVRPWVEGHYGRYRRLGVEVPEPYQASAPTVDFFNHYHRNAKPVQFGQQPWSGL